MRRKLVWAAAAVVLAAVAIGTVLLRRKAPEAAPQAANPAALPSGAGSTFTGTVRPQHVVNFGPTVKGMIDAFMAEVGDQIAEGQTLVRLGGMGLETEQQNATEAVERAQNRVTQAQNNLGEARLEESRAGAELEKARAVLTQQTETYTRQKTRIAAGAISKNAFAASEKEYQAAVQTFGVMDKAHRAAADNVNLMKQVLDSANQKLTEAEQRLQQTQADIDAMEVRSPMDGWLVARQGQPGQPAENYGDQMFQITTDLANLEVALDIKKDAAKRIYPGMQALVLIPEALDSALEGKVKSAKDTEVIVEFVSPTENIRPGMKADVRFRLN